MNVVGATDENDDAEEEDDEDDGGLATNGNEECGSNDATTRAALAKRIYEYRVYIITTDGV